MRVKLFISSLGDMRLRIFDKKRSLWNCLRPLIEAPSFLELHTRPFRNLVANTCFLINFWLEPIFLLASNYCLHNGFLWWAALRGSRACGALVLLHAIRCVCAKLLSIERGETPFISLLSISDRAHFVSSERKIIY